MDLSKPGTPDENDTEDNVIGPFTDAEQVDYDDDGHAGRNSSGDEPALKDQSHRLHRSSSCIARCTATVLAIPAALVILTASRMTVVEI